MKTLKLKYIGGVKQAFQFDQIVVTEDDVSFRKDGEKQWTTVCRDELESASVETELEDWMQ